MSEEREEGWREVEVIQEEEWREVSIPAQRLCSVQRVCVELRPEVVIEQKAIDLQEDEWETYHAIASADFQPAARPSLKLSKRNSHRCSSNMRKLRKAHQQLARQHPLLRHP